MKVLIDFFLTRGTLSWQRLLWMGSIAAVANTLVLTIINTAAAHAAEGAGLGALLAAFIATELVFVWSQRYILNAVLGEVGKIIHRYRQQQVERVRHCDLDALERIGMARIYDAMTRQTRVLTSTAGTIALGIQSIVVVAFALFYLAWLNLAALVLTLAILGVGGLFYAKRMRAARAVSVQIRAGENELFDSMTDLSDGFKEVRLNVQRSADLAVFIERISRRVLDLNNSIEVRLTEMFVFFHFIFFGTAAAIVFLMPGLGFVRSEELLKVITVILFLLGPIFSISGAAPAIANASVSCDVMLDLERRLDEAARGSRATPELLRRFQRIELRGAVYHHRQADGTPGFQVGPLDFSLRAGETVFISGGNGSGKSTALRLLTALYMPQEGELTVDGDVIGPERREAYQNLFSTVFSDFHLFQRTFGLADVAPELVGEWLARVEIADKTGLHDGRFDTIKLSTGQRKRLALVVAALEDRPVYVFDEFAADQDPGFRRKFYDEILPALKAAGKSIVAVTHDERYFDRADRHLVMQDGRFVDRGADHV